MSSYRSPGARSDQEDQEDQEIRKTREIREAAGNKTTKIIKDTADIKETADIEETGDTKESEEPLECPLKRGQGAGQSDSHRKGNLKVGRGP